MRSRASLSNDRRPRKFVLIAAATALFLAALDAAFLFHGKRTYLTLSSEKTGELYARYPVKTGDTFSVGFIHSVNKSPVTDYYEIRSDGIYVVKTVYYGFGAGVQTELEGNETLEYGEDGSMIVSGFDRRMDNLIYFVGTVSDHTLVLNEKETVSLRDLCGRNAMVRFRVTESFR